ncbi:MAG: redoxin domain-containing protein [Rikenellaceae bacterium]
MKKLTLLLFLAYTLVGCKNPNLGRYEVIGTVSDSTFNGQMVDIIIPKVDGILDSTLVVDNKFKLKGKLPQKTLYQIRIRNKNIALAATEDDEPVTIGFGKTGHVITTGTNSMAVSTLAKELNDLSIRFMMVSRNIPDDKIVNEEHDKFRDQTLTILRKCVEENTDNLMGVYAIWQLDNFLRIDSTTSLDSLTSMVPISKESPIIKSIRYDLERFEATQPGAMFTDFDGKDANDNPIKLSDFVGKGKYVLASYWTGWAGACWEEIPYMKENYAKYKDKGLVVLGINIWDKKKSLMQIIETEELNWDMIFALDNRDATKLYGVQTMPTLILFAPDGTIVNRTVQGEETGKLLEEIFGE